LHGIAIKNRQLLDLLALNGTRQLRARSAHQIGVRFNPDGVGRRADTNLSKKNLPATTA